MTRNRIQWSEQEHMMASAYANIASSFSQITAYMKNHLRTVQNGGGIITEGDMEEIYQQLSDMINKNLHNVSQMRVKITTENVAPNKSTTNNSNSNLVSTTSSSSSAQFESKQPQRIRITEGDLHRIIKESVNNVLTELDWKTYANATKKRYQQYVDEKEPQKRKELHDKYWDLKNKANQSFDNEYIGDWKYDTMLDKMKGKESATFRSKKFSPDEENMARQTVVGYNKKGDEIFANEKGSYYSNNAFGGGYRTPRQHFRDSEIATAFERANDEIFDYADGNYEYQKGKGWVKK